MAYKVAVLMGGTSHEREFSLESGRQVCNALEAAGHEVLPLDTTLDLVNVLREEKPDVAYSALHGKLGEDGTIASLMELLGIPLVGCPAHVCRQAWNKSTTAATLQTFRGGHLGVAGEEFEGPADLPRGLCLTEATFKDMGAACALDLIAERIPAGYPLAVKPACGGSAMGITRVESEEELPKALLKAFSFDREVVVEEWVEGVELAVSVLGQGEGAYALPPVEIVPQAGLYDTMARMEEDRVEYFAPVRLESLSPNPGEADAIRAEIERAALEVYDAYGCRDLARVDMIWDGGSARVLEIDTSPGMTNLSLFPMACHAAGLSLPAVLNELCNQAVARG